MPSLGTITLAGKSGTPYKFRAYPQETVFKKGLAAVFLVTRRSEKAKRPARHKPLFLGQSGDIRSLDMAPITAAMTAAANCICVHAEQNETARMGIQQDLMDSFHPF